MQFHTLPYATPALALFAWMADCIRAAIAPHTHATTTPGRLLGFFHAYIARSLTRLATLHAAWRAGTIRPSRARATRINAPQTGALPPPPHLPPLRLPRGHLWLIKQVQATAIGQGQLQSILADPDFTAFIAAVPRAGRILRPLCTALGLEHPAPLRLPPRPRKPRPPRPPRPPGFTRAERYRLRNYSPGPLRPFPKPALLKKPA